jgi:uncharacterized membrane protein
MTSQVVSERSKLWVALCIVAVVVGVLMRFSNLGGKVWLHDEVYTSLMASSWWEHRQVNPAIRTGMPLQRHTLLTLLSPRPGSNLIDVAHILMQREPNWPPVFFLGVRLVMDNFGSEPAVLRVLPALFGSLAIPAMGVLCWRLFRDRRIAWTAMALLALSPLFVQYSQQARPYMLSMLLLLLAHHAFLRALAQRSIGAWAVYGGLQALCVYNQPLVAVFLAGHGLYLLIFYRCERQALVAFSVTTAIAVMTFLPWLVMMWRGRRLIVAITGQTAIGLPPDVNFNLTLSNISRLLLAGDPASAATPIWIGLLVIVIVVYALFRLLRDANQHVAIFILIQVALAAVIIVPDILRGGRTWVTVRYFLPSLLILLPAIACMLVRVRFGHLLLPALLIGAAVSSGQAVVADDWWEHSRVDRNVQALVNAHSPALIVTPVTIGVVGILLHDLDPDVQFLFPRDDEAPVLPDDAGVIFLYQPTQALLDTISDSTGREAVLVYEQARWDTNVYRMYRLENGS